MSVTTVTGYTIRDDIKPFPVLQAAELEEKPPDQRWLVEGFWPASAVGVLGGHPKSFKTWWGLELAISVATGTDCLGRFKVKMPGRVLVYLAEDPAHSVRDRLDALSRHHQVDLGKADLHVLSVNRLRLDSNSHLQRLDATLAQLRPRLLLLDPLVRLHSGDENAVHDVTPLLGHLRILQRRHDVAVALVHHARKNAHRAQHGQSLRGTGDIFAWADVLHYLNLEKRGVRLNVEHRSAPAPDPLLLHFDRDKPHLTIIDDDGDQAPSLEDRVLQALARGNEPLRRQQLRSLMAVNNQRLGNALQKLEALGRVRRTARGWQV